MKRICISMPPELEQKIVDLRKYDQFSRKSISEIIRIMVERGLESFLGTEDLL